jgi:hypothetical protein
LSRCFDAMYAKVGRPSIPPEQLLRAQLLQMLYSIRSEGLLMEEIDYSMLFRWFIGLNLDDEVWDATVFTKNRTACWKPKWPRSFWRTCGGEARAQGWASDEHFHRGRHIAGSVGRARRAFSRKTKSNHRRTDERSNETHESKTGSGVAFGAQRRRQGIEVELHRELAGGESQRVDHRRRSVSGQRHGGARGGADNAGETFWHAPSHGGRR